MPTRIPTDTRNAMAAAAAGRADGGAAPGKIRVYTGAQPASANDAASGTLLVTFTLNDPAYAAPATGVCTLDVDPEITADPVASGTAGWFRLLDSDDNTVVDGACGTSGAQLNLTTTTLEVGVDVTIVSGTMTQPAG